MRRAHRLLLLGLLGTLLAGGVAGGLYWAFSAGFLFPRVQSIAVLEFDLAGLSPNRSTALSLGQRLVEMIGQLSSMNCKPAVLLKDDLVRRGLLPRDAVVSDAQAVGVARGLGVSKIVVGTATFTDGVFLAVRLLDARSGKRVSEAELSGKSSTEVRDRMGVLVYQLLGASEKLKNLPPEAVLKVERSPLSTAQPIPQTTLFRDEEITLSAESSRDPDGRVIRYEWDFTSDGRVDATQARVSTKVPTQVPGEVTVTLTVEDDMGARTTHKATFLVLRETYSEFRGARNVPPTARIDISREIAPDARPTYVLVGEPLTLDGRASSDPDGTIVRYEWDIYGDGTVDSTSPQFKTTLLSANPGTAIVILTVTDDLGAKGSTQLAVDISTSTYRDFLVERNKPPQARIQVVRTMPADIRPPQILTGEPLTLDGRTSSDPDGTIVRYEWDIYADGTVDSTAPTFTTTAPTAAPGTAVVVLRVTDDLGGVSSARVTLEVSPQSYRDFLVQRNTAPVPKIDIVRSPESLRAAEGVSTRVFLSERLQCSAEASYDPDPSGRIVRWEWDLNGDGSPDEFGPVIDLSSLTLTAGRKKIVLVVTDDLGAKATQSVELEVLSQSLQQRQQVQARWNLFWITLAAVGLVALGILGEILGL